MLVWCQEGCQARSILAYMSYYHLVVGQLIDNRHSFLECRTRISRSRNYQTLDQSSSRATRTCFSVRLREQGSQQLLYQRTSQSTYRYCTVRFLRARLECLAHPIVIKPNKPHHPSTRRHSRTGKLAAHGNNATRNHERQHIGNRPPCGAQPCPPKDQLVSG